MLPFVLTLNSFNDQQLLPPKQHWEPYQSFRSPSSRYIPASSNYPNSKSNNDVRKNSYSYPKPLNLYNSKKILSATVSHGTLDFGAVGKKSYDNHHHCVQQHHEVELKKKKT